MPFDYACGVVAELARSGLADLFGEGVQHGTEAVAAGRR
jgi:hypothetical protein